MKKEFVIEEEVKKLNELTGKIVSMALNIEDTLEFFISNYFIKPQNQKTLFLNNLILKEMNFQKKREIFKEICKREKFDGTKLNEVLSCIRIVQKIRNDFANRHCLFDSYEKKVFFGNRKKLVLSPLNSEKILKKVEENKTKALDVIIEFYQKYYNEGTIDERPINFENRGVV